MIGRIQNTKLELI